MKHSVTNRRLMIDWLRHCEETGEATPTAAAIAERFGFADIVVARTLIAELADAREITIKWLAGGVWDSIKLGTAKPRPVAPTPVINRGPRADSGIPAPHRLKHVVDEVRPPKPLRPVPAPLPSAELTSIMTQIASPADELPASEELAAAPTGEKSIPRSAAWTVRTLGVSVGGELRGLLEERQRAEGVSMSSMLLDLIKRGLSSDPPAAPTAKPRMSAAVVRAFQASGEELGPWLSRMVEAGVRATGVRG